MMMITEHGNIYIYSTPLHVTSLNILVKNFEKLSAYFDFFDSFCQAFCSKCRSYNVFAFPNMI